MFQINWTNVSSSSEISFLCNVISKLNHIKQKYGTTLSYINIQCMIVLLSSHPDMLGRAVRILLFLWWIYKRSVMPVFNNKRSFAFLICSYAVELYFLCRKKRMGKRSYTSLVWLPLISPHVVNQELWNCLRCQKAGSLFRKILLL